MKRWTFLIVILVIAAVLLFSGCDSIWPGAGGEDLSAVVTIIDALESMWAQDINWWQTKGLKNTGCSHPFSALTMQAAPLAGGIVYPISGCYELMGEQTGISAIANSGYEFDFWTHYHGIISDLNNPSTIFEVGYYHEIIVITAHFKQIDCCDTPDTIIVNTPEVEVDVDVEVDVPVDCGDVNIDLPIWNSEFDKYIYVYFNIENTGSIDIQEYTVCFTAYGVTPGSGTPIKSTDYTTYTGCATGEDLAVGEDRDFFAQIDVSGDKVVWVELANLEIQ